jgi:hypothetical protein
MLGNKSYNIISMKNEIEKIWDELNITTGEERKKTFIRYCNKLIECKEKGEMTEEEASYRIVGAIQFEDLNSCTEFDDIFDCASVCEIPRDSLRENIADQWNQDVANKRKEEEWKNVVKAVFSPTTY